VQRLSQRPLAKGGIFISYAAEDRERAKALAHMLEQRDWSVWWDRKIRSGESFDEAISAEPHSRVTIELTSESSRGFTLRIDGQNLTTNVLPVGVLEITADNASVNGIDGYGSNDSGTRLEVALPADSEIRYADYPRVSPVRLRAGDFVGLGALEGASLNGLKSRADAAGIALQLEGVAGRLETSSTGVKRDRRLTMLETFWHGSRATMLLVLAACVLTIAVGVYRLYTRTSADR
jgi:hypothetical protein